MTDEQKKAISEFAAKVNEAVEKALDVLHGIDTEALQDATEAAETHDFKEGELIVYVKGTTAQIGEIKRLCSDGAFVYYHEGDTASKTPFDCMLKLDNAYCIKKTSLAQYRPICDDDCEHCDFATCPKEE